MAIVVPCYNEHDLIRDTNIKLTSLIKRLNNDNLISSSSYILYVDDGSDDESWTIIKDICHNEKNKKGMKLSRNFGHQNALLAGLSKVDNKCDFVISIDADLQQDIEAIPKMINQYNLGSEIVFGIRNKRKGETIFKRFFSNSFNKIMKLSGSSIIKDHADFRLMGNKALNALLEHHEDNIFLRGLIPKLGFKTSEVKFDQSERLLGKTKYSPLKMINLAYDGLSSLSSTPLRFLFLIGFLSTLSSIIWAIYVIYAKYVTGQIVPGWASIILSIWFFSSIQLMALGLIGEYLSKIFFDVKKRPRFIIEELDS